MKRGHPRQDQQLHAPPRQHHHDVAKAVSNYTNSIPANMPKPPTRLRRSAAARQRRFRPEGAGENMFVVKNGVIYTPDLSAGALNGITRNTMLHIAKDLGLEIVQSASRATRSTSPTKPSSPAPLPKSPHPRAGSHRAGQGATTWQPRPITEKSKRRVLYIVNGRNPQYAHWLTGVGSRPAAVVEVLGQRPNAQGRMFCPNPQGRT